jgi:hypothetical protein
MVGGDAEMLPEPISGLLELAVLLEAAPLVVDMRGISRVHEQLGHNGHAFGMVARETSGVGGPHSAIEVGGLGAGTCKRDPTKGGHADGESMKPHPRGSRTLRVIGQNRGRLPQLRRLREARQVVVAINCSLLPFDADGDGRAQGDEREDLAAGGIGTDALFGFEVDRRELTDKNVRVPITRLLSLQRRIPVETVTIAGPWVRTAPLTTLAASAPYLHNGSVPSLEALLEPSDARPVTFTLGTGRGTFTFDTRLPGNRNTGHEFGVKLSAQEKRDLIAFLLSL